MEINTLFCDSGLSGILLSTCSLLKNDSRQAGMTGNGDIAFSIQHSAFLGFPLKACGNDNYRLSTINYQLTTRNSNLFSRETLMPPGRHNLE